MSNVFRRVSGAALAWVVLGSCPWGGCAATGTEGGIAMAQREAMRVGGPCEYVAYPGSATVLSVRPEPPRPGEAPKGTPRFEVRFRFVPDGEVAQAWAKNPEKEYHLQRNDFTSPDEAFLKEHGIREGAALRGVMRVIVKGTCTPVLFAFPDLGIE